MKKNLIYMYLMLMMIVHAVLKIEYINDDNNQSNINTLFILSSINYLSLKRPKLFF